MGNTLSAYKETEKILSLGKRGSLKGIQFDDKACRYVGVPYALPPTGQYRWRKPRQLPSDFSYSKQDGSPYDATEFRPPCPQAKFSSGAEQGSTATYTEDCLIVNIWTPVAKGSEPEKKWPVFVWLHGGWFQMGDASQDVTMDPTELISTGKLNAICVSVAYRLNVFGFLASDELLKESNGESAGNFGLWDQRLALEWVKENIGLFNGDCDNITLAGRSAGAYGVHAQVLHDFRQSHTQLFHRIFMCSNTIPAQPKPLAEAQPQFDELCAHFGVPPDLTGKEKLSKLRDVSQQDLVDAMAHLRYHTFRPVTDDLFFFSGMVEYQRSGEFANVFNQRDLKLLIGEVLNEETLYAVYNPPQGNYEALRLEIINYYGPTTADRVLSRYQLPAEGASEDEWRALYGRIISDGQVRAPERAFVHNLHSHGVPLDKIWRYQVAYRLSFITEKEAPMSFGVSHAMDKPFWNYSIAHGPTAKERTLMDEWIKILVAFVNNDTSYDLGTRSITDMKVATPEATVEIQHDNRWEELRALGETFAGS